MLPKCSLIIYICINAFDYNAVIVYFSVLKPGTLYETWYYPSYQYFQSFVSGFQVGCRYSLFVSTSLSDCYLPLYEDLLEYKPIF